MKNKIYSHRLRFAILLMLGFWASNCATAQIITTIAGNGTAGYSGDGGAATAAELDHSSGVAVDGSGNVFIADGANHRIRKVTPSGTISTIVGNGTAGYSGDGGAATAANISTPIGMAVDASGNLYFADFTMACVRKVTPAGIISTFAGNGTSGFSGDSGAATAAKLSFPCGVAADGSGNVYIADEANQRIRMVTSSGTISTIVGNGTPGYSGDGGAATAASIYNPKAVAIDGAGTLYFVDELNQRVRKVTSSGIISTIAGNGTAGYSGDGGVATAANLYLPQGVAVDGSGNVYIADKYNSRIRKVTPSGIITTYAGDGYSSYGGDGGAATAAQINNPSDVAVDGAVNLYIADYFNSCIRKVGCTLPYAAPISGTDSLCPGLTTTFTDTITGGTWVSANSSVATVNSTGMVTSVSTGTTNILYIVTNSCGSDTAFFPFVVRSMASCPNRVTILNDQHGFSIYPNPNQGNFTVNISSAGNEKVPVTVTNLLGKKVKQFLVTTNTTSELRLDAPAGVYFVSAATQSGVVVQKVVITE